MISSKDLELDTAYNEAVKELETSLASLKAMSVNETNLALRFVDDSHVPLDAIERLANKIAYTKAVARRVADARSALINHRFNR